MTENVNLNRNSAWKRRISSGKLIFFTNFLPSHFLLFLLAFSHAQQIWKINLPYHKHSRSLAPCCQQNAVTHHFRYPSPECSGKTEIVDYSYYRKTFFSQVKRELNFKGTLSKLMNLNRLINEHTIDLFANLQST